MKVTMTAEAGLPPRVTRIVIECPEGISSADLIHEPWGKHLSEAKAHVAQDAPILRGIPRGEPHIRINNPRDQAPERYAERCQDYLDLLAAGVHNPIECLAKAYQVKKATAANWMKAARRLGYLEPASPGRACVA